MAKADSCDFMKGELDQPAGMTVFNFSEQHTDIQNNATMQT